MPAVIAAHGGRYLVRGGASQVLEGDVQPKREVILQFPDMAALKAFWASPEYARLEKLRLQASRASAVAIEGV